MRRSLAVADVTVPRFSPELELVHVHPVQSTLDGLPPAGVAVRALLVGVPPEPAGQAGRVGGAEGGGLRDDRAADRNAEDVGLQLHGQVVGGYSAIYL